MNPRRPERRSSCGQGLFRKAGEDDVEIFFDSASFNRGAVVTLTGLLVIIILLAWRPIMRLRAQA